MVRLTQTSRITAALEICVARENELDHLELERSDRNVQESHDRSLPLPTPQLGGPITHDALICLSKFLCAHASSDADRTKWRLESFLKGSAVYIPAPSSKPPQSSEYQELMARLRHEEDSRRYARMTVPPFASSNPFTISKASQRTDLLSSSYAEPDDQVMRDVNRQVTLIINILVSIAACAIAVWLVSSSWAAPARLALSMVAAVVVGVAEVVVYWAYLRKARAILIEDDNDLVDDLVNDNSTGSGIKRAVFNQITPSPENVIETDTRTESPREQTANDAFNLIGEIDGNAYSLDSDANLEVTESPQRGPIDKRQERLLRVDGRSEAGSFQIKAATSLNKTAHLTNTLKSTNVEHSVEQPVKTPSQLDRNFSRDSKHCILSCRDIRSSPSGLQKDQVCLESSDLESSGVSSPIESQAAVSASGTRGSSQVNPMDAMKDGKAFLRTLAFVKSNIEDEITVLQKRREFMIRGSEKIKDRVEVGEELLKLATQQQ
ncbi:MAG: hypothetical protein Q9162_004502 [Coniocarpon cinnabarinum]